MLHELRVAFNALDLALYRRVRSLAHTPQIVLRVGITMDEAEKEIIKKTLEFTQDNKTKTAKILDISLKTLHNKLNEYRLRPQHQDKDPQSASS